MESVNMKTFELCSLAERTRDRLQESQIQITASFLLRRAMISRARAIFAILYCIACRTICRTVAGQTNLVPSINESAKVVSPIDPSQADPKAQVKILDQYGKLPLSFEANDPPKYLVRLLFSFRGINEVELALTAYGEDRLARGLRDVLSRRFELS
jgi:hypothetical protein